MHDTSLSEYIEIVLERVLHSRHLQMRLVEASADRVRLALPYQEAMIGDPLRGTIHGGALTTLMDMASGMAVIAALDSREPSPTLDLRIDYLRPAAAGATLYGVAHAYRVTRSVVFVEGQAYQGASGDPDTVVARTMATFARIDPSRRRRAEPAP
jgi:uncharacterized protein (TIGR00369 family)